jgi:hypothetical protein
MYHFRLLSLRRRGFRDCDPSWSSNPGIPSHACRSRNSRTARSPSSKSLRLQSWSEVRISLLRKASLAAPRRAKRSSLEGIDFFAATAWVREDTRYHPFLSERLGDLTMSSARIVNTISWSCRGSEIRCQISSKMIEATSRPVSFMIIYSLFSVFASNFLGWKLAMNMDSTSFEHDIRKSELKP